MASTNSTPDIPEEDKRDKDQQQLADLGLADHRPLTTADIPALKELLKPKRSSGTSQSSSKSKSKSGGSK